MRQGPHRRRRPVVLRSREIVEGVAEARAALTTFGVDTTALSDEDILRGIGRLYAISSAPDPSAAFAEIALSGDRVALALVRAVRPMH